METLSNETRNKKAVFKNREEAFNDWINEWAEAIGRPVKEVAEFALIKLENEEINNVKKDNAYF